MSMKKSKLSSPVEGDSVRFHHIGKIEFWVTPLNKIFLIVDGRTVFPSLNGSTLVTFDVPELSYTLSDKVKEKCRTLLKKQRQIRQGWTTFEEDNEAWTWSL